MKGNLPIGFILACLMTACTASVKVSDPVEGSSPTLAAIDSLMWQQPDSALALLLPYFDTCCRDVSGNVFTVYNRHYAHLLLAELLYKNDYAQTNRMELIQAVDYFDSLCCRDVSGNVSTIAFLDARAHYINGVGYNENDSVVEACNEYLKALEMMENHFEEKELVGDKARLMALTYTHLTDLFSSLYLHEQAIYYGKESLAYYNNYDASVWHVGWILNEIGSHYDMMKDYDSAYYYYHETLMVLPDTNNLTHRDVATLLAFLSYNTGGHPKTILDQLKELIAQSESPKEALSRCAIVGDIYYHEKQFDSAWVYLDKVFRESLSIDSKKQAAELLVEICKAQGKEDDILEYASFLVPFATQDEDNGTIKSQLAELYNQNRKHKLKQQNKLEVKKQTRRSLCVVIGLLIVTLGIFVLYRKNKKRKQSLEMQIKEEKYAYEIRQRALAGRLKQRNEALRTQEKEKSDLAKEMIIQKRQAEWNHLDDFMTENICNDIVSALRGKQIKREAKSNDYPELHLSDTQLHDLSVAVENHFSGFEKTMTNLYPRISRKAMHQCMLYLMDLEDVQIAALLACDYSTVKRRSAKLRQAFGTEKELRQFIREFVL